MKMLRVPVLTKKKKKLFRVQSPVCARIAGGSSSVSTEIIWSTKPRLFIVSQQNVFTNTRLRVSSRPSQIHINGFLPLACEWKTNWSSLTEARHLWLCHQLLFFTSLEISECSMSKFPKLKVNEVECVFPITISLSYGDPEKHGFPFGWEGTFFC